MSQGGSWGHGDFLSKCGDILSAVQGHLGQGAPIFGQPVNPKDYPDYPRCAILAPAARCFPACKSSQVAKPFAHRRCWEKEMLAGLCWRHDAGLGCGEHYSCMHANVCLVGRPGL